MLRVIGCITDQHDFRLVILAGLICFLASFTAFSLIARVGASGRARHVWLLTAAAVTGSGVWATHFVAMLAFRPGLPIGYDVFLTSLSVVAAIGIVALALVVALYMRHPLIGGVVVGLAIVTMHYTGMAAIRLPAAIQWDTSYVAASIVISLAFGAAALCVGQRRTSLRGRMTATTLLVLAICGLHFTAMAAVVLVPDPTVIIPDLIIAPDWLAVAVAAITLMIIGAGLVSAVIDQHLAQRSAREAEKLRLHVVELEAAKRELTAALEAADAASQAKSQFLATMSHELRTPLNAIIGFSQILKDEFLGKHAVPRYRDYADNIFHSGSHLLGLINDVLDMSKLDAHRLELFEKPVEVGALVAECVGMLAILAEKGGVQLTTECQNDLPLLQADERRLRQIVLNLLSNAIKFTPPGGLVRVSALNDGSAFVITVADSGIGMAQADIPKALEPFGQVDSSLARKFEGSGLGLPLTKQLVELHGGSLAIDSTPGEGTTITATFGAERMLPARKVA